MRRTVLLAIFALVLASCGGDTEESEQAEGTSPRASTSASATTGSATASPTPEPNVVLPSDLLGTWSGDVVDPGWEKGPMHSTEYKRTVWSLTVTLQECDADGRCGYETMATQNYGLVGGPLTCGDSRGRWRARTCGLFLVREGWRNALTSTFAGQG